MFAESEQWTEKCTKNMFFFICDVFFMLGAFFWAMSFFSKRNMLYVCCFYTLHSSFFNASWIFTHEYIDLLHNQRNGSKLEKYLLFLNLFSFLLNKNRGEKGEWS